MKSKLQVNPGGQWLWVAGINKNTGVPITTTSKRRAMPAQTYWCVYSIDVARKHCPDHTFRLAESLED
jgi:hypothetical protein